MKLVALIFYVVATVVSTALFLRGKAADATWFMSAAILLFLMATH